MALFVLASFPISMPWGTKVRGVFANMGYLDTKHRALGAGDVLDSPAGIVSCRDMRCRWYLVFESSVSASGAKNFLSFHTVSQ